MGSFIMYFMGIANPSNTNNENPSRKENRRSRPMEVESKLMVFGLLRK
jgi:hypothetical protein